MRLCTSHRGQTEKLLTRTGKSSNRAALGTSKLKRTASRSTGTSRRNTYELLARANKPAQDTALRTPKLERSARLTENKRTARLAKDEGTTGLLELEGSARYPTELEGTAEEEGTSAAARWETRHIAPQAGKGEVTGIRWPADIASCTVKTREAGTGDFSLKFVL